MNTVPTRLFILDDHYLYYYKTSSDDRPVGVLELKGCQIEAEPEVSQKRRSNAFSVSAITSWKVGQKLFHNRKYLLCADRYVLLPAPSRV